MISPQEKRFYLSIKNELEIIFDVGCKKDSIYEFLDKKDLIVHAFDPSPRVRSCNGSIFNNIALGNEVGLIKYYDVIESVQKIETEDKSIRLKFINICEKRNRLVPIDTLYNYCKDQGINKIDLLKIDAEGWDFEVIKGAEDLIWKIKYISFELGWPRYGEYDTLEDIFNYFPKDYNFYDLLGNPHNCLITKEKLVYNLISTGLK